MKETTEKLQEAARPKNVEEKKEGRNDSFPYALKSLKILVEKIERNGWLEENEINALKEAYKKMVERYIGLSAF